MKSALQQMLDSELQFHLKHEVSVPETASHEHDAVDSGGSSQPKKTRNRRNGLSPKTVQGDMGKILLEIPRDRVETFEPQLLAKHQRRLTGFDEKILAL